MEDLDKGDDIFLVVIFWVNVPCACAWHKCNSGPLDHHISTWDIHQGP